jgi:lipoic acid synthetase
MASYRRSLDLLSEAKKTAQDIITKSSIMVGMGESPYEVFRTLDDLSRAGVDIVTIGQYLAPSRRHYPVFEYVSPQRFEEYRDAALGKGFSAVASGPLVRSSFEAEGLYRTVHRPQSTVNSI